MAAVMALLALAAPAPSMAAGPWQALVVDAGTQAPLEGVAVLARWHRRAQGHPAIGLGRTGFHSAVEATSGADGRFRIPARTLFNPPLVFPIEGPEIALFKAEYGANLRMHGGNVFGSSSSLIWAPDYKFAVSLLFNGAASPDDAALCAYTAFHPLTEPPPPNTSLPPSEWGKYAGNYRGRFYGHWDWRTGGEIVTYDGLEITPRPSKWEISSSCRFPSSPSTTR